MAERYEVVAKIVSIKGTCTAGHKVGDEWVVGTQINDEDWVIGGKMQKGICAGAFSTMCPYVSALIYGGSFSWGIDHQIINLACPDPDNPVVFELRRLTV